MNGRRSIRENAPFSLCPPAPPPPAYLYRLRASARANSPTRKAARGGSCGEAEAEPHRRAPFRVRPGSLAARRPRLPHPPHRLHQSQRHPPLLGWLDEAISIGVLIQKCPTASPPKSKPAPTPNSTTGSPPTPTSSPFPTLYTSLYPISTQSIPPSPHLYHSYILPLSKKCGKIW